MNKPATRPAIPSRAIKLGGRDLTIRFGMKAVARLEEAYDDTIARVAKRFQPKAVRDPETNEIVLVPQTDDKGEPVPGGRLVPKMETPMRVSDVQKVLWAGFAEHHPEITQDGVIDLLEAELAEAGNLDNALTETMKAWSASGDEEAAPGKGGENPPPPSPETSG